MVARRVDLHLTASERYAKEISATVGVPEPLVVPNYPPLASLDVEDCLRPALGVGDETIVLLYQGGFYLQTRALDVLIRAMPSLPPQYHLGLLGFGPHGEETQIHEWIREAGVIKRVTVVPAVPHQELPAWTIGADIGIIPFRLQRRAMQLGSPNKLYEYMGVGLPIVTTAAEEPVEILNATGAGRVYNADDPDDFVAQVGGLGNDRAQLRRMGNRNRRAAEDHYSWEKVSADLANAYGKMLKR
jgi:glycosyltransferase involved in cell wall biosynthesis